MRSPSVLGLVEPLTARTGENALLEFSNQSIDYSNLPKVLEQHKAKICGELAAIGEQDVVQEIGSEAGMTQWLARMLRPATRENLMRRIPRFGFCGYPVDQTEAEWEYLIGERGGGCNRDCS